MLNSSEEQNVFAYWSNCVRNVVRVKNLRMILSSRLLSLISHKAVMKLVSWLNVCICGNDISCPALLNICQIIKYDGEIYSSVLLLEFKCINFQCQMTLRFVAVWIVLYYSVLFNSPQVIIHHTFHHQEYQFQLMIFITTNTYYHNAYVRG